MRVCVIGGGLFGCTAAVHAAIAGHDVHLYETRSTLMGGASGKSYYRLHRGYHYPRSPETGRESLEAEASFRREYGDAVIDGGTQIYAIAREGSKVTGPEFMDFMGGMGLHYKELTGHDLIVGCDWMFKVEEPRIDPTILTVLVKDRVRESGVTVHCGCRAPKNARSEFDCIIVAAYDGMNEAVGALDLPPENYKYQVVEKPVVQMPMTFRGVSIVVLDGPFCCIDPHAQTNLHVLGHVTETVHTEADGTAFSNVRYPSKFDGVVAAMKRFMPDVAKATHVGSVYVTRAVLAGQERTDARPTVVKRLDDQVVQVFSGKLGTAVVAAQQATREIERVLVAA